MTEKVGATIGKFMPFHKGHKHMIDSALAVCDVFYIIVSGREDDAIPLSHRVLWLEAEYDSQDLVTVIKHEDNIPVTTVDKDGTCTDPEFWKKWEAEFNRILPEKITHFVSSDMYGKKVAEVLNCEWLPIDPGREYIPISGTQCRYDMEANWNMLTEDVRRDFVTTVAIVGPESTGKTTLARSMTPEATYIPEYGRHLSEVKPELELKDFQTITLIQDRIVENARWDAEKPLIVTDTEAYTTYLFSKFYTGEGDIWSKSIAEHIQQFDLYVLLAPTVPWVQDGTRVVDTEDQRQWFFDEMKKFLDKIKANYIVVDDEDFAERRRQAYQAITKTQKQKLKEV